MKSVNPPHMTKILQGPSRIEYKRHYHKTTGIEATGWSNVGLEIDLSSRRAGSRVQVHMTRRANESATGTCIPLRVELVYSSYPRLTLRPGY